MNGIEIIFQLGDRVLLALLDGQYFKDRIDKHNRFKSIDHKLQREYNYYQYIWANEEVSCRENDFNLIQQLIEVNGGKEIFKARSQILLNGK